MTVSPTSTTESRVSSKIQTTNPQINQTTNPLNNQSTNMKKTLSCLVSCAICAAFTLALSSCDETDSYIAEQLRNRD